MISREAGRQFNLNSPLTNSDQDFVSSASSSDPEHVEGERARAIGVSGKPKVAKSQRSQRLCGERFQKLK